MMYLKNSVEVQNNLVTPLVLYPASQDEVTPKTDSFIKI
jgi:hypothetical protein